MPWYFSIEDFPEVKALPPEHRRTLLAASGAPGRGRLLFAAFWRGLLLSIVLTGLFHAALVGNKLGQLDRLLSPLLFVIIFLGTTAAFHHWMMLRYRRTLQASIREASRGERAPFCPACGHDLTGIDGETCPECGATASIPDAE